MPRGAGLAGKRSPEGKSAGGSERAEGMDALEVVRRRSMGDPSGSRIVAPVASALHHRRTGEDPEPVGEMLAGQLLRPERVAGADRLEHRRVGGDGRVAELMAEGVDARLHLRQPQIDLVLDDVPAEEEPAAARGADDRRMERRRCARARRRPVGRPGRPRGSRHGARARSGSRECRRDRRASGSARATGRGRRTPPSRASRARSAPRAPEPG